MKNLKSGRLSKQQLQRAVAQHLLPEFFRLLEHAIFINDGL